MEPTQELADSIYREKVLRARATPPEQKLLAGTELFTLSLRIREAALQSSGEVEQPEISTDATRHREHCHDVVVFQNIVDRLRKLGVRSMLVGGYCSTLYGAERMAAGPDFVVDVGFERDAGESLLANCELAYHENGVCLFALTRDPHDQERFPRRVEVAILDREVSVSTPEDVIITKIHWSILGNRTKDRDDARDVIAVQGDQLDWDYIYLWADRHGTRALLDEIRRSIPPM